MKLFKRILWIITIICLFAAMAFSIPAGKVYASDEFSDVADSGAVFYKPIYWAVNEGIVNGFGDGTFRPEDTCTREQFVVMIWRYSGKPSVDRSVWFTDIDESKSTYKAIMWAVDEGIIKGFADGTFMPEDTVTRAQVAVMLWRLAGRPEESGGEFPDVSPETTAGIAIQWGSTIGIIKGFQDGTFRPDEDCLRQQIAIFLYRYAKNLDSNFSEPLYGEWITKEGACYYIDKHTGKAAATDTVIDGYKVDEEGKSITRYRILEYVDKYTSPEMSNQEKIKALYYWLVGNDWEYKQQLKVIMRTWEWYDGWTDDFAVDLMDNEVGDCYQYSAFFGYLVKEATGYKVRVYRGSVADGYLNAIVNHGWMTVYQDGDWYAYDPQMEKFDTIRTDHSWCYKEKYSYTSTFIHFNGEAVNLY